MRETASTAAVQDSTERAQFNARKEAGREAIG